MMLFGLAFIIVGQLGRILFSVVQTYPAVILAPNGIALAALILHGGKYWKYVWAAAFINALLNGVMPVGAFLASILYVLQATIGAAAFHWLKLDQRFSHLRDTMWFSGIAIITTTIVPAGGMSLLQLSNTPTSVTFPYWWLGNVVSALVFTPLIVRGLSKQRPSPILAGRFEIGLAFTLLVLTDFLFWTKYPPEAVLPLVLLQLGIFTWIALRMGMSYMSWAAFISSVIFLCAPFYGFNRPPIEQLSQRIVSTEIYMCIFAILFYYLSSASEERDEAFSSLRKNIEELERSNEKIRAEDARKNEFIAILAHELRSPLSPITNHLNLMDLQGVRQTPYQVSIDGISRQVKNMARLLEDLLDISRITHSKINLHKTQMDLRKIIFEAVGNLRSQASSSCLHVSTNLPPAPVWIEGDPLRIEQILNNLLSNAFKYTPAGGKISISCVTEGADAVMSVHDEGIGISSDMLEKIFDPFVQADNSITRLHGGLGIGLRLVRSLTELHGGTVQAKSEGLGTGSCFTVRLPLSEAPSFTEPQTQAPANELTINRKILVVDDNQDVVESMTQLLKHLGHDVVDAHHGEEALRVARAHRPALVLLDIGLPGMSGYEVAALLRQEFGASISLVAVSGYGQEEDRQKSKASGFDKHLTKPVNISDIKEVIGVLG